MGREAIIWGGNYFELPPSRGWLVWHISIEKEEKYCLIAKRRLEEAIGVGTLFDPKAIEAATLFADCA